MMRKFKEISYPEQQQLLVDANFALPYFNYITLNKYIEITCFHFIIHLYYFLDFMNNHYITFANIA